MGPKGTITFFPVSRYLLGVILHKVGNKKGTIPCAHVIVMSGLANKIPNKEKCANPLTK